MILEKPIPKEALKFTNDAIKFSYEEGQDPKLQMVGYSGGVIKNHWYWGNLAINLKGMRFDKDRYPILEDHDTDKKIAFTTVPSIESGALVINPEMVTFLDTDDAKKFIANSKKGFPYQASIHAEPTKFTRLDKGESVEVNGMMLEGPGTVWDECSFMEVSACVFGYDSNTTAKAMKKEDQPIMDIKELKVQYPDLCNQIVSEAEVKFTAEKASLETKIAELSETLKAKDKQIMEFEKDAVIRKETEMATQAEQIWSDMLSKSAVPTHLFAKVKKHVVYGDFVKEGAFNIETFSKAITDEIKDWEDKGVTATVIGGHFGTSKGVTGEPDKVAFQKENDECTNNLLKLAGVKI
jgi:hypothetical protein